MPKDINELLISIRDSIKSFVDGEMSLSEARDVYLELENSCIRHEEETQHNEGLSYLGELLYYHNTENFAKVTSLLKIENGALESLEEVGGKELVPVMHKLALDHFTELKDGEIKTVTIKSDDGMSYNFLFHYVKSLSGEEMVLATAASSVYFESEKFASLSALARNFLHSDDIELPLAVDYLSEIRRNLHDFAAPHIEAGVEMEASLFIFDDFTEIFSHMGLLALARISEEIHSTLRHSISYDDHIIAVNLNKYLVVSPLHDGRETEPVKEKMFFIYDDIFLNYTRKDFHISSLSDFHRILLYRHNSEKTG